MKLPFLSSLFTKSNKPLLLLDSIPVKRLKSVASSHNFLIYNNVNIYHHANSYKIALILLDISRGLYIFERKEWSYDELKNANIEKADNQENSNSTLSYQKTQNIINQKFNEITHHDGVPIFNYLLMENLNTDQYEHLDDSFKELLPKNKVIFSDSNTEEIIQKLEYAKISETKLPSRDNIIGNLLIQYTILEDDLSMKLCTNEQMKLLDSNISGFEILNAKSGSGKSNIILLKAILEKLQHKDKRVVIIKPTILACDILKKKLLDLIEHAIVEIDLTSILVLTPIDLINLHLKKLKKEPINKLYIDDILLKKKFDIAELILCDDSDLYDKDFLNYILHIQKNANILMVNSTLKEPKYRFTQTFIENIQSISFHQANQYAKALQIIAKLLHNNQAKDITLISNEQTREYIHEDLKYFIEENIVLLDSSKNLVDQKIDSVKLSTYDDVISLELKHIVLLDISSTNTKKLEYTVSLAKDSISIIYEEECDNINILKEKYGNH